MKLAWFYFLLFFSFFELNAQFASKEKYLLDSLDLHLLHEEDKVILDSVLSIYHNATDSVQIECLSFLAENLADDDLWVKYNEEMLAYANSALKSLPGEHKSKRVYYLDFKNRALNNKGYVQLMQGNYQKAIHFYNKSKAILEETEDKHGLAVYHNTIGYIYINQGAIAKGLEQLLKSLKIKEELPDKGSLATTLTNIGYVYKNQKEHDEALDYFERSLLIREELDDKAGIAICLGHIGSINESQKKLSKALEYYLKAYELSSETRDDYNTAFHLFNIGSVYHQQAKYSDAIRVLNEGLKLKRKLKDKVGIANGLLNLGEVYLSTNDLKKAEDNGLKALAIVQVLDNKLEIRKAAILLYNVYKKLGGFKKSLSYFELAEEVGGAINNEETQKAAVKQQMEYEFEKQQVTDSLNFAQTQAIEKMKHQAIIDKEVQQRYLLYGGLAVLLIIGLLIFRSYHQKKKDNELITIQKNQVESAHEELAEKNAEIVDSINYAKRIQNAILPPIESFKSIFEDSFIYYQPKDIVAGDFYWMQEVKKEGEISKTLFAVADCTGHGVPGAMVSVVCNNALNRAVREYGLIDPAEILGKVREIVSHEFSKSDDEVKDGMDIALCCLMNNGETIEVKYAGANNPLWIVTPESSDILNENNRWSFNRKKDKNAPNLHQIKADKQPIGKYAKESPFTTHIVELTKGDTVYLMSDGYVDQFGGEKGKKFMTKNLRKFLLDIHSNGMTKQEELLASNFNNWMEASNCDQVDDVCVMGIRV